MSVRILSFNAIHSVIKKMFHKGPTKLGTSVDGHEKTILTESFIEIAQEINKICITTIVQENVILHYKTFYFSKTCVQTWNFSLPKKLDLGKTKRFCNWPSSFCSRYPNICDRTKKMDYSLSPDAKHFQKSISTTFLFKSPHLYSKTSLSPDSLALQKDFQKSITTTFI
jgi:hypothetical protein